MRFARYSLLLKGGFLALCAAIVFVAMGAEMSPWVLLCFALPTIRNGAKKIKRERLIDLENDQYAILKRVIESCIPYNEVWAYGSRVKWNASEDSDLDLVVMGAESDALYALRYALEESDLSISVDVMDWESIPDDFKENIKRQYAVMHKPSLMPKRQVIKFGKIATIFTGKKNVNQTVENGAYKFFSCSPNDYYSNDYICDNDAIIITGNGAYTGTMQFYSGKFDLYQRTYGCTLSDYHAEKFDIKYLFYFMKEFFEKKFMGGTRGSTIPYIVKGDIENFLISYPPLHEQKAIAQILDNLNKKIDLLHQQNKTLESMAQMLFRKSFVENSICQAQEKIRIHEVVHFTKGRKPLRAEKSEFKDSMPQILIDTFKGGNPIYSEKEKMVIAEEVDILMVMDGASSGRTEIGFRGVVGSTIGKFSPKENFNFPLFIFHFLKRYESHIKKNTTGSAIPHADTGIIFNLEIPYSNVGKISEFEEIAKSFYNKGRLNHSQIMATKNLRNALLPKMMSGKIRVQEFMEK